MHGAAEKSQDAAMLKALREGLDLHRTAAAGLYNKLEEDVTSTERFNGKTANFATMYGASAFKMMETFGVDKKKAEKMLNGYFEKFPGLRDFQESSYQHSIEFGYIVADDFIRRKIYIQDYDRFVWLRDHQNLHPEFKKEFRILSGQIFRKSANFPIQSLGATMTKLAGIYLREAGLKIVLQIHDEYVIECLESDAERVKLIVEDCMKRAANALCKSIQVPAEAVITKTWSK